MKETHTFKDFVPLISLFVVLLVSTWGIGYFTGTMSLNFLMRIFMGLFFVLFGTLKIIKWKAFADAYATYDIVARRSRLYAYAYPLIELGLGISYLIGWQLFWVNIVTIVVMQVSAIGVLQAVLRKDAIACACLGMVFAVPLTWVTLFEDELMAVMALIMLLR